MNRFFKFITLVFLQCFAMMAISVELEQEVENFRLLDHQGNSHELFYYDDKKAIVFLVQGNGCPIVRNAAPRFEEIRELYSKNGIEFFMINSNLQDNKLSIKEEAEEFGYKSDILIDETQLIGSSINYERTGEVFVVDPKSWKIIYSGALDDRLTYENQKEFATKHFLEDALLNVLNNEPVELPKTKSLGCLINFQNKKEELVSYSEEVAPILIENCVSCHRKGGVGPWAMTEYEMIKGFSFMIKEVVLTKRMPPWHADPGIGHFSNDRSLDVEETKTLIKWIDSGSPRGEGVDPLKEVKISNSTWANEESMGPPDYIIDIPVTTIPSTGVVDYKYHYVPNSVGKDVWVKATEIVPGDRPVLHHVITSFGEAETRGPRKGKLKWRGRKGLRGYAPGINSNPFPDNSGIFLPANSTFEFQMHYTPVGRETIDSSKMGIWVAKEKPEHEIFSMVMVNPQIRIPAGAREHKESASRAINQDALLYSVLPHAHYRGKKMIITAYYPDGNTEVLLSVPNYDFNWQTSYDFNEPKFLPAGTTLIQHQWWDNSSQNKANPDHTKEVTWGDQSFEEMLFGAYMMRYIDKDNEDSSYEQLLRN